MQPNLQLFIFAHGDDSDPLPANGPASRRVVHLCPTGDGGEYWDALLKIRPEAELIGIFGWAGNKDSRGEATEREAVPSQAAIQTGRYAADQLYYTQSVPSADMWSFLNDDGKWAELGERLRTRYQQANARRIPIPASLIVRADHFLAWQGWFAGQRQQVIAEIAKTAASEQEVVSLSEDVFSRLTGWFLAQRYQWDQIVPLDKALPHDTATAPEEAFQDGNRAVGDRPSIVIRDAGEEKTIFTLPSSSREHWPSGMAFAVRKSGSVLLNRILRALCDHQEIPFVSIPDEFFRWGLPLEDAPANTSAIFEREGYFYGGFRRWPVAFDIPILSTSRPVLLLRDPRDRLVSDYYSMRESHSEPGKKLKAVREEVMWRQKARSLDIDQYVKQSAPRVREDLELYRDELCAKHAVKIYRYEDVIYNKREWIADIARNFGWDVPDEVIADIAAKNDVIPDKEETKKHVRQVHPGNYREKLDPATIDFLTGYFQGVMAAFGYDLSERR